MRRIAFQARGLALAALLLGAGGCAAFREDPLEEVAKDWMRVIRASQVIPIYPLTEDLQPGDVFLVQTPVEEQAREWQKSDGYLPLDYHIARLDPGSYAAFYDHSFLGDGAPLRLPHDWLSGRARASANGSGEPASEDGAWLSAPGAAFPTYGFSVDRGGGLNLAVPVSSVPVGLSLLGAEAVEGSLSLGRARTLGVDIASIYLELQVWGDQHRDFLAIFGERENYLRVVTRVYLVGKVDVSMRTTLSSSAGLDAGQPRPVELLLPRTGDDVSAISAEEYGNGIAALNGMLQGGGPANVPLGEALLPGGSVRITAASARSISMSEEFDRPLVVGFLGFDVPILEDGELGPPIPTRALLEREAEPVMEALITGEPVSAIHADAAVTSAYEILAQRTDDPRAQAHVAEMDALAALVPERCTLFATTREGLSESVRTEADFEPSFTGFKEYIGALGVSTRALERAVDEGEAKLVTPDGTARTLSGPDLAPLSQELDAQRSTLASVDAAFDRASRGCVAYLASLIRHQPRE